MSNELEPFKTSDTSLAAYLNMKGMTILPMTRTDPNDSKREVFIFIDIDLRPEYEREFYEDVGEFRKYYRSLRSMNGLIAEARRRQYGN